MILFISVLYRLCIRRFLGTAPGPIQCIYICLPRPQNHPPHPHTAPSATFCLMLVLCMSKDSLDFVVCGVDLGWIPDNFNPWACEYQYSLHLLFSSSLLLWAYEAILPKHGCHFKQPLIKAKVLNILIYCYYLLVRRSSMHLLSKFELKIPPSYSQTTF